MNFDPNTYEKLGAFFLGREAERPDIPILYDARDLTTHAMCAGADCAAPANRRA